MQKYILYLTLSLSFAFLLSFLAKRFCANMFGKQIKATTSAIQQTGIFLCQLLVMNSFSLAFVLLTPLALQRARHTQLPQTEINVVGASRKKSHKPRENKIGDTFDTFGTFGGCIYKIKGLSDA